MIDVKETFNNDHEQFQDKEYKKRREYIADFARRFKFGDEIEYIHYTDIEHKTWERVYNNLVPLHKKYFCKRYNEQFSKLLKAGVIRPDRIPQIKDLDSYLRAETGIRLMPVTGIVDQREFLNALGLRVFCTTQYIRHPNHPDYTPEPDICHEIFGHIPMFADEELADLSQEIGLLSLGVDTETVAKMGALYLYTIEFGSIIEEGKIKPFGAGIAGSSKEIENIVFNRNANFLYLDPNKGFSLDYPIQDLQYVYYYSDSLKKLNNDLLEYGKRSDRQFKCYYDFTQNKVRSNKRVNKVGVNEKSVYHSN